MASFYLVLWVSLGEHMTCVSERRNLVFRRPPQEQISFLPFFFAHFISSVLLYSYWRTVYPCDGSSQLLTERIFLKRTKIAYSTGCCGYCKAHAQQREKTSSRERIDRTWTTRRKQRHAVKKEEEQKGTPTSSASMVSHVIFHRFRSFGGRANTSSFKQDWRLLHPVVCVSIKQQDYSHDGHLEYYCFPSSRLLDICVKWRWYIFELEIFKFYEGEITMDSFAG